MGGYIGCEGRLKVRNHKLYPQRRVLHDRKAAGIPRSGQSLQRAMAPAAIKAFFRPATTTKSGRDGSGGEEYPQRRARGELSETNPGTDTASASKR